MPPKTPKTRGKKKPEKGKSSSICKICGKECLDTDLALTCDLCDHWLHKDCENVSDIIYEAIDTSTSKDNVAWFCTGCKAAALPLHKKFAELELRVDEIERNQISKEGATKLIEDKVTEITDTKVEEMKKTIDDQIAENVNNFKETIEKTVNDSIKTNEKGKPDVDSKIREVISYIQQAAERQNNIIIHRIKESSENETKDQVLKILNTCDSEITAEDINECKRLGKQEEGKDRPVWIKLDEGTKKNVMKNLRKLKGTNLDISITHDLPPGIRANRKQLMEQAKAKHGDDFLYKFVGKFGTEKVKAIKKTTPEQT